MDVADTYPALSVTTFPPLPCNFAFFPPALSPANNASKLSYA